MRRASNNSGPRRGGDTNLVLIIAACCRNDAQRGDTPDAMMRLAAQSAQSSFVTRDEHLREHGYLASLPMIFDGTPERRRLDVDLMAIRLMLGKGGSESIADLAVQGVRPLGVLRIWREAAEAPETFPRMPVRGDRRESSAEAN
jgi:hypothetical protein